MAGVFVATFKNRRLMQPLNASSPIVFNELGKENEDNAEQLRNAARPISMRAGASTKRRPLQFSKALSRTETVNLLSMTESSDVQPNNIPSET